MEFVVDWTIVPEEIFFETTVTQFKDILYETDV